MFSEDAGKPDQSMSVRFSGPGNVFVLVPRRNFSLDKVHPAKQCSVKTQKLVQS